VTVQVQTEKARGNIELILTCFDPDRSDVWADFWTKILTASTAAPGFLERSLERAVNDGTDRAIIQLGGDIISTERTLLRIMPATMDHFLTGVYQQGRTNPEGRHTFHGVSPGVYWVFARQKGTGFDRLWANAFRLDEGTESPTAVLTQTNLVDLHELLQRDLIVEHISLYTRTFEHRFPHGRTGFAEARRQALAEPPAEKNMLQLAPVQPCP
jgi:hypothetical protein